MSTYNHLTSAGLTASTSYEEVVLRLDDPVVWTFDNMAHVGGDLARKVMSINSLSDSQLASTTRMYHTFGLGNTAETL